MARSGRPGRAFNREPAALERRPAAAGQQTTFAAVLDHERRGDGE
jgi:hypothetical protein